MKRNEIFLDKKITNDLEWRIDELLRFSEVPGINDALEGDTSLRWFDIDTEETQDEGSGMEDDEEGIGWTITNKKTPNEDTKTQINYNHI